MITQRIAEWKKKEVFLALFPNQMSVIWLLVPAVTAALSEAVLFWFCSSRALAVLNGSQTGALGKNLVIALLVFFVFVVSTVASALSERTRVSSAMRLIRSRAIGEMVSNHRMRRPDDGASGLPDHLRRLVSNPQEVMVYGRQVVEAVTYAVIILILFATCLILNWWASLSLIVVGAMFFLALLPVRTKLERVSAEMSSSLASFGRRVEDLFHLRDSLMVSNSVSGLEQKVQEESKAATDKAGSFILLSRVTPQIYLTIVMLILIGGLVSSSIFDQSVVISFAPIGLLYLRILNYGQRVATGRVGLARLGGIVSDSSSGFRDEVAEARKQRTVLKINAEGIKPLEDSQKLNDLGNLPILRLSRCEKLASGRQLWKIDDLRLFPGEKIAIIGESGAGKSTLLKCIAGLDQFDSGEMKRFDGRSNDLKIEYVPQEITLIHAGLLENIDLFRGFEPADLLKLVERLGLQHLERADDGIAPHDLALRPAWSGGEIQRIGIARALIGGPDLLILDEPTSALNSELRDHLFEEVIASFSGAVLLVTHDHVIASACDKTYDLSDKVLKLVR